MLSNFQQQQTSVCSNRTTIRLQNPETTGSSDALLGKRPETLLLQILKANVCYDCNTSFCFCVFPSSYALIAMFSIANIEGISI